MATTDFQDWELLHSSSDSDSAPLSCPDSDESFNEIDAGGLIQVNYFSLDAHNSFGEDMGDDKSAAESDNPSWIDPESEGKPTRYINRESGEFWSDSGSDRSEDRKVGQTEAKKEMFFSHDEEREVRVEGAGEILEEDLGVEISSTEHGDVSCQENNVMERNESGDEVMVDGESKENGELKKRSMVWWKMPVEFLKYCVFRMSPVWAFSVAAAAMMGFAILGRRLYKMKKRTKGLEIKVTVDGKNVSQVMSRAARLNEAFSIVKRVPVIRPSLPVVGSTTTWPIMSLR
ncbi:Unknown protein [Striga hermonthica]|uniref:DUF6821 domain-containing protein n=1 Tax=Striga hermonthica TaxID=68872 RepID=A0A9N7RNF0_STRHE|nr:Unknown protein [Striga hermonthica]